MIKFLLKFLFFVVVSAHVYASHSQVNDLTLDHPSVLYAQQINENTPYQGVTFVDGAFYTVRPDSLSPHIWEMPEKSYQWAAELSREYALWPMTGVRHPNFTVLQKTSDTNSKLKDVLSFAMSNHARSLCGTVDLEGILRVQLVQGCGNQQNFLSSAFYVCEQENWQYALSQLVSELSYDMQKYDFSFNIPANDFQTVEQCKHALGKFLKIAPYARAEHKSVRLNINVNNFFYTPPLNFMSGGASYFRNQLQQGSGFCGAADGHGVISTQNQNSIQPIVHTSYQQSQNLLYHSMCNKTLNTMLTQQSTQPPRSTFDDQADRKMSIDYLLNS